MDEAGKDLRANDIPMGQFQGKATEVLSKEGYSPVGMGIWDATMLNRTYLGLGSSSGR